MKFKDFNETVAQLRLGIDNEVCALFRNAKIDKLDFTNDEDIERLAINEHGERWLVETIEYYNGNNTIEISIADFNVDFTDCDTDDMVAVYEAVWGKIFGSKEK